ncbi:MAG: chromate resistance protein [Desulfobacterales bacterium]|nr:chromate resistance protein [Desulfobacterales bacterium]
MATQKPKIWLVLIHQIPPEPNALRVKIWRRLHQIGAVAIKQSVYVLPLSEQSREDLSWTLKEIVAGGGGGSISEVRFVEGLTDDQIIALFRNARKAEYQKLIQAANLLIADWSSGKSDPRDPTVKGSAQVARLQRRLDNIADIDFFKTPERGTAEILIKDLATRSSGNAVDESARVKGLDELKGKVWVTRKNLFVDRLACGWLIRRFVEETASFKFVAADTYAPGPGEIRFDMFEGEFTHEGDSCTFEMMIKRLGLQERGLTALAEIIHDIDLKDSRYERVETDGLNALLTGLAASQPDDDLRMQQGIQLIETMFTYLQGQK